MIIKPEKQIRIKDIAEKANVSIGTVDRVLHNRGEVAESTKNKILKIVKEQNYKPNILASMLASKKSATFATLFPKPPSNEGYWNKPVIGVKKRVVELKQYNISVKPFTFNQSDSKSFLKEAEKIVKIKPDGVALAPFFSKESKDFINQLRERSIPFVFIDSEIKNAGHISYIGQNSFQSGKLAGKLIDLMIPAKKGILIIHFAKEMDNQNHLVQREKGFYEWFKNKKNNKHNLSTLEISDGDSGTWQDNVLREIKKKHIAGIFVTNSKVFYIARLIELYGLKNISVIGHDLLKENIRFLEKEVVHFLIYQQPELQGYNAINKLFRNVIQKRKVALENYTSIEIITKENVEFCKPFK